MKLKAKDTIHVSSVKADPIRPAEVFEVSDDTGKQLLDRGLATRVGSAKATAAPRNKAAPKPRNQAARSSSNKGSR